MGELLTYLSTLGSAFLFGLGIGLWRGDMRWRDGYKVGYANGRARGQREREAIISGLQSNQQTALGGSGSL